MAYGLNPDQKTAVETLSGPLLVLAGAGSGKTRVVTYRIANLIRSGTPASRILAVTFTNKAAAEMQERVRALQGRKAPERPSISTFHSHCVKVLRRHIARLGFPVHFGIYSRGEQVSMAHQILREIHVPATTLRPVDLVNLIGRWKTRGIQPAAAAALAATDQEHLGASAYRRYQKSMKLAGAVDFDDLLLLTEELLSNHPDVLREEAGRFDHILVDEYQDTNASQYRIIRSLAEGHRNLCVVGDDDQSIYGWRGAEVEHILRFRDDWREAKIVRLEQNYRSTAAILTLANTLIAVNKVRHAKVLRAARPGGEKPRIEQHASETKEAESVSVDIRRRMQQPGMEPRDFAILFRTNEQPRAFELALRKQKVPYVLIGGKSFYDRREIRDVLAYLRLLVTPDDETSLRRVINCPPRGIGQKGMELLTEEAVRQGKPLWNVVRQPRSLPLSPKVTAAVEQFVTLVETYAERARQARRGQLVDLVRDLLREIGYQAEIHRLYTEPEDRESRWASVEELVNSVGSYERDNRKPTLLEFLDEAVLGEFDSDDREKDKDLKRNGVMLMTMHSAKGLEFPYVYLVGLEEGILPHKRSIQMEEEGAVEEERRLCYVGVTRAQERLTISFSATRMKWGQPRETIPSRFLWEMIGEGERAVARRQASAKPRAPTKRPTNPRSKKRN